MLSLTLGLALFVSVVAFPSNDVYGKSIILVIMSLISRMFIYLQPNHPTKSVRNSFKLLAILADIEK